MKRKRNSKHFNLFEEYKKSFEYIKESKKFIYLIIAIFFFFFLIGFFVPAPEFLYDKILEYIRGILEKIGDMSFLELIWFIILNNIKSTFFGIIFGVALGVFPILSSITNGYMLGFVSDYSIRMSNGNFLSLWRILPHGVFELPAVFISLGLGVKIGMFIFQKDKRRAFKNYLNNSLKAFLLIIIPLLIIAGFIEGILMTLLK
jgi:stage II sporulation protein M